MLLLSRAKVTIHTDGQGQQFCRVEGEWEPYQVRIRQWLLDLPVERGVIRHLFGRIMFSREFDSSLAQRVRNFLVNECPLKRA